jgi:pimeloyl-ACP methyl ester carboxylesterase
MRGYLDPAWRPAADARATVIFVHGAVVNGLEMALLRHRFRGLGYRARQFHYQSMTVGLEENVRRLGEFVRRTEGDVIHVVGHSMGGVLTRLLFERVPEPRPGRLVAIGSPFLDCWIGHRISGLHPVGRYLVGRTVRDHLTGPREAVWRGARDFGVLASRRCCVHIASFLATGKFVEP